MGDQLQRQALARDLSRRAQLASHDELRVIDRVLLRLELGRERYGLLDLREPRDWRKERGEELLDAVIYDVMGDLAQEDHEREQLREAARAEMVGEATPVELKPRTRAGQLDYIIAAAQRGEIAPEVAREMIDALDGASE